jgi:hypothetical protein
MTTRPLVPVLAALLVSAVSCKPDRSKPRIGAADAAVAASPALAPAAPIAPTVGGDAGAAAAPRGQAGGDAGEPTTPGDDAEKADPDGPAATPPAGSGKAAAADDEDRPENLKVLPRTMTVDQVTEYMSKQVGRGLGVKCGHCHKGGDFAADRNPHKKKARAMIRMTADLNQRFFGGKRGITCFTCHQGRAEPGKK